VDGAIESIRNEVHGAKVSGIAADLAMPDGISQSIQAVPALDVLVNNLGVYEVKSFEQITDADWHAIIETNFYERRPPGAPLPATHESRQLGSHHFHLQRIRRKHSVEMIHYGVTKTMQVALARGLAETTAGSPITVNSVLAGPTRSEGLRNSSRTWQERKTSRPMTWKRNSFIQYGPTRSCSVFATSDEVAALVAFVASPLSSATNGAALRVEGEA
jgi:NAD(P)-dependent dehydrogenase (short-subunit alcohol dehydrogenase family)